MTSFMVGSIAILSNIAANPPLSVHADGDANLAFFKKEEIVKIGENLYNENDREIIRDKLTKTKKNW